MVLFLEPDAHANVARKAIAVHRADNDALLQKLFVDGASLADLHREKFAWLGKYGRPRRRNSPSRYAIPLALTSSVRRTCSWSSIPASTATRPSEVMLNG